jgi:hypothetical protein
LTDDPKVTELILRLAKRMEDKERFNYSQACFDAQLQNFIDGEAVDRDIAAQLKKYNTHAKVRFRVDHYSDQEWCQCDG